MITPSARFLRADRLRRCPMAWSKQSCRVGGRAPASLGSTTKASTSAGHLGPYRQQLFDSNGNAVPPRGGTNGSWRLAPESCGEVVVQVLGDLGAEGRLRALEYEAEHLTDWLDGTLALPRFPSPRIEMSLQTRCLMPLRGPR